MLRDLASDAREQRRRPTGTRFAAATLAAVIVACSADEPSATAPVLSVSEPVVATFGTKIVPAQGEQDSQFGRAVACDGTTLVMGQPYAGNLGQAIVYSVTSTGITEQITLEAPSGTRHFGAAVAVDGDTIVVGAPYLTGARDGDVLVYRQTGGTWSEEAHLSPGLPDGALFGCAVDIQGDRVVIGASHAEVSTLGQDGAAYVYERSGTAWSLEDKIEGEGFPFTKDGFGTSVALDGDTLVVGAAIDGFSGMTGEVFVFSHSGSGWGNRVKIEPSSHFDDCLFGWAVDIEGDTLVAGCPTDGGDSGTIIYERQGTSWSQVASLTFQGQGKQSFGRAVALSGDVLWVGAEAADVVAQNGGALSVYVYDEDTWSLLEVLTAPDADAQSWFGASVTAFGSQAIAGMPGDDEQGNNAGAAWLISLKGEPGEACLSGTDCASSYCVDGVCCESECGGGATDDCLACSVAAGASSDGTCTPLSGVACDDGDLCTESATCVSGTCEGSDAVQCAPPGVCQEPGTCQPTTGECSYPASPNGTDCLSGGTCEQGVCVLPDGGTAGTGGAGGAAGGSGGEAGSGGASGSGASAGAADSGLNADGSDVETSGFYACALGSPTRTGAGWGVWLGLAVVALTSRRRISPGYRTHGDCRHRNSP